MVRERERVRVRMLEVGRPAVLAPIVCPNDFPPPGIRFRCHNGTYGVVYLQVSVEFEADGGRLGLRASGRVLRDPGYLRAYNDDEPAEGEEPAPEAEAAGGGEDEGAAARENQGLAAQQLLALQVCGAGRAGGYTVGCCRPQPNKYRYIPKRHAGPARGGAPGLVDVRQLAQRRARTQQLAFCLLLSRPALLRLTPMCSQPGARLPCSSVAPMQHATRPPPRFTEASLVRALEERGIGRPSTYAPIMTLLQVRGAGGGGPGDGAAGRGAWRGGLWHGMAWRGVGAHVFVPVVLYQQYRRYRQDQRLARAAAGLRARRQSCPTSRLCMLLSCLSTTRRTSHTSRLHVLTPPPPPLHVLTPPPPPPPPLHVLTPLPPPPPPPLHAGATGPRLRVSRGAGAAAHQPGPRADVLPGALLRHVGGLRLHVRHGRTAGRRRE